ncbi:MAG: hypothetical protein IPI90_10070 [Saprospiraceae bacterium]|nr:hypothetical protein [Candidatus Vicinibacter affinis]
MSSSSYCIGLFCLFTVCVHAQNQGSVVQQSVRKGVIYNKEKSIDMAIQTNGFFVGYNSGKLRTYYLTNYFHLDFGLLEHPREVRLNKNFNHGGGFFSSFTYGKRNSLWNFRAGKGFVRYFSEKDRKKGVALGIRLEGGVLMGILKPYYLRVIKNQDGILFIENIKYSESTKDVFLDLNSIVGASSFGVGLTELNFAPGAYGRMGIMIDPGAFEKYVRALNFGLQLDLYPKRVPIMASRQNPFAYLNFYLNLQFGSRK